MVANLFFFFLSYLNKNILRQTTKNKTQTTNKTENKRTKAHHDHITKCDLLCTLLYIYIVVNKQRQDRVRMILQLTDSLISFTETVICLFHISLVQQGAAD